MEIFILLFIAGLIIGSFLNVVSLRYAPGQPLMSNRIIGGRSKCRTCATTLRWYELVPLFSFLIQGAKCRHCEHALNWQYPIVEALTGLLTAAIPLYFYRYFHIALTVATGQSLVGFYLFTGIWLLATYAFIVTSVIDFRYMILPDQITIFLGIMGLGTLLVKSSYAGLFGNQFTFLGAYAGIFNFNSNLFINTLTAVVASLVLFGCIIALTKGRGMGMGDLKIGIPIALLLGWPDAILSFMSAFVIGSVFGILLLLTRIKKLKDGVPFGPFLVLGVYVAMFYGESIVHWYFTLLP